jgi:5-methylcytosine-specific restriction enzyme subunit McrC
LNSRYRAAHLWASVLLGGGGIDDLLAAGELGATSLLVRTDRVWEGAVARACSEAAVPAARPPRIRVLEDSMSVREFRPDTHLHRRTPSGPFATPVDAKYKDYANRAVDRDDVHQLLTYAAASAEPTAVLVYPVVGPAATRGIDVRADRRTFGRIDVVGLDTRLAPQVAVEPLRERIRHGPGSRADGVTGAPVFAISLTTTT